jgi:myo-inositol catabolism protein IolS
LMAQFLEGKRNQVLLATKGSPEEMSAEAILQLLDESLERLCVDAVDLYYIHWPHSGKDMRPLMEGLEKARAQAKIRAIGVSNFDVEQMEQVSRAGTINVHQLCYTQYLRKVTLRQRQKQ